MRTFKSPVLSNLALIRRLLTTMPVKKTWGFIGLGQMGMFLFLFYFFQLLFILQYGLVLIAAKFLGNRLPDGEKSPSTYSCLGSIDHLGYQSRCNE